MVKKIDVVLEKVLVVLMAFMVLNVLWQVTARHLLQTPSSYTDELARYLLIWVGLLGAAYASGRQMHLAIDLLPEKLNPVQKNKLYIFINFVVGLFALLVMVIGGLRLVYITLLLGQTSAALSIPLGYVYLVVPLSGVLIIFYAIHYSINLYKEIQTKN